MTSTSPKEERLRARLARYPPDWKAISDQVRFERAGGRCECTGQCGLHRGRRCIEEHGKPATFARGKIVLTTAHLNHEIEDCSDENLCAMCPRCHNRYDLPNRRRHTREWKRALRGRELPFDG